MLIDCATCTARGAGCSGCMVRTLLDTPDLITGLTGDERRAVEALELAGFEVELLEAPPPASPPLRLAPRPRQGRSVA
jgi:hypothetical protein